MIQVEINIKNTDKQYFFLISNLKDRYDLTVVKTIVKRFSLFCH